MLQNTCTLYNKVCIFVPTKTKTNNNLKIKHYGEKIIKQRTHRGYLSQHL